MLALRTLGGLSLVRDGVLVTGAAARKRPLALLAAIAAAGAQGISRATLTGRLWAESDETRARNVLAQTLYGLRRDLGHDDLLLDGPDLRLDPACISADVIDFVAALAAGDDERAVAVYGGPFLDGFYLSDAPEFERWAEEQRAQLEQRAALALERVARARMAAGDSEAAVTAWRRLAAMTPLNARVVLGLMDALAASGDTGGALQAARVHAALVLEELGAGPDAAVQSRAEQLRLGDGSADAPRTPAASVASSAPAVSPMERESAAMPNVSTDPRPVSSGSRTRSRARPATLAVFVLLAGTLAAYVVSSRHRVSEPPRTDTGAIAVLPFRVAGAEPSLAYLREGMMDLIAADLASERGPHAMDPRAVLQAVRRSRGADGADLTRDDAIAVAHRAGAELLLLGSVVGTPAHVELRVALVGARDGRTRATAEAAGPPDSLAALVDHLVRSLLAGSVSDDAAQAAALTGVPLGALRAYVDGAATYRRGEYAAAAAAYSRALDVDSTFALAAIGLYTAGNWIAANDVTPLDRGLRLAYAARMRLPSRDRATLLAWVGPRFPAVRRASYAEDIADWERAVAAAPDRAEVWYELGDRYFHGGPLIGRTDAWRRAATAFRRSVALDSSFTPPLEHLLEIAASAGDTAEVRALLAVVETRGAGSDVADFVRWRAATALHDDVARATLRAGLATMRTASLERIVASAQQEGTALADADSAAVVLSARASTPSEREQMALLRLALARNRSRSGEAREAMRLVRQSGASILNIDRMLVMNDLSEPAPADERSAIAAAVERLSAESHRPRTGVVAQAEADVALCTVELWRSAHGRTDSTSAIIQRLRQMRPVVFDSARVQVDRELCAAVLVAELQLARGSADARSALRHADSLARDGRRQFPMLGANALNILLARLWEREGDRASALAAVRRRAYHWTQPQNLSTYLREEGRLAALVGDSVGAVRAYRHYLALREGAAEIQVERSHLEREVQRLAIGAAR